jgi:hypothetical protein
MHSTTPCVLDIEASGFGRHSYPIEIGYVLPNGRAHCWLVQPAPHWLHWDAAAEQLHGISRQQLLAHGRPVRELALALNRELAQHTVYCDGWAHDYAWLAALFEAADCSPSFKLESVNSLLTECQLAQLDAARRESHAALKLGRHRASNDARALQTALVQVQAQVMQTSPAGALA